MYSNYTIIIYKGELHDNYVCHLFGYLFSGPNSAFDSFIDLEKDYWYTWTEVPAPEIIHNSTVKYNNMVAEK